VGELGVVWERELHQAPTPRSAFIAPTLIVVQERQSKLCRVSPVDGSAVWVADVKNPWGWVACSAATCVYLNQHSLLQCFNLEDGVQRWAIDLAGSHGNVFGFPVVVDDRVIVGGWRGYSDLLALSADDGALAWARPAQGHRLMAPVPGPDRTLLLPFANDGRATLVSAAGEPVAEWSCPRPDPDRDPDASPFVVRHGDRFVCLGSQGRILELDPTSDRDWVERARHPHPIRSYAPAITESLLLLEDNRSLLCAYSLTSMTQLWEAPVHHRRPDLLPAVGLPSGAVAFAAASGQLYLLDDDGHAIARFRLSQAIQQRDFAYPGRRNHRCNGGRLVALDTTAV